MPDEKRLTRRRFVALGAGGAVVLAGGGTAALLTGGEDRSEAAYALSRDVAAAFDDGGAARALGRAYRDAHPDESRERQLVEALRRANPSWNPAGTRDVLRLARAEARRDYEAGRVVGVGGWYLSRTEARLYALTTFA